MRLEFSGAPEIPASAEHVWDRLMDHEFVAACVPGVETVEALDETHFKVVSGFGVGNIRVRFTLDVELSEVHPPTSAKMSVRGKAPGSAVQFDSSVSVEPLGPDRTRLDWFGAAQVHGKLASVGARLMKGTAQRLTEGFWQEFARRAGGPGGSVS